MKKKMISIMLIGAMIFSMTACGGKSESNNESDKNEQTEESEQTNEEEVLDEITFEGLTVVDNEYCKIMLTEVEPDNMWGYTIKALLENKTADKTYMYSLESVCVNGVQVDPFFASEVAPGKQANEEITIYDNSLTENGIEEFTDLELSFRVYNSENWEEEDVVNETVHVYPYGEDKVSYFTRETEDTDNVIVDNEFVTITVIGNGVDELGDFLVNLYIQNKSEYDLMLSADNVSLNGFMMDPYWVTSVKAGKNKFNSISWYASDLETNSITEATDAEFNLRVYKVDYVYSEGDIVNQGISLQF